MKYIKKPVCVLLIMMILALTPLRSNATPAVIVTGVMATGAMLLTIAGVKYSIPTSVYNNYFSSLGTTGRIAVATWNAINQYAQVETYNKLVTAKIAFDDLIAKAVTPYLNSETKPYPNLFNALAKVDDFTNKNGNFGDQRTGKTVKIGNTFYLLGEKYWGTSSNNNYGAVQTFPRYESGYVIFGKTSTVAVPPGPANGWEEWYYVAGSGSTGPAPQAKTLQQVKESEPNFANTYSGEIDALITAQPNIVHFADTVNPDQDIDSAPPFVPATNPPPSSIVTTPTNPLTSAQQAATRAAGNAAADPNNPGLQQTALDTKARSDALQSELESRAQTRAAEEEQVNSLPSTANVYDTVIAAPALKSLATLLENFYNSTPFSSLVTAFTFNASGACSQEYFTAYEQTFTFDLCPYEQQIQLAGTITLFFAHLAALFIVFSKKSAGD